ncbi:TadE/TadG family type IV pilus assembly protein [Brevibacillus massiliensis]|jgi:hypothetical protein|uniref:TadE/TadG family type IV pilus assembly protein n=1 Tax=Brevibacillus massiliensis TaxID=1118054 RepID=UPI0002D7E524|nr:TadE/TadG family type IV pilus assembly protein [Brevibacillus massiliensis]
MRFDRVRRFWKEERGSQLLEFIFVFPLLWVLLMFSFDQFAIMFNKQKALAAAYEAGRIACVQPNAGLASYHGQQRGMEELDQAIGAELREIRILPQGRWRKGNHFEARATLHFTLPASGGKYEVTESYHMMIENAEGD